MSRAATSIEIDRIENIRSAFDAVKYLGVARKHDHIESLHRARNMAESNENIFILI